MTLECLELGVLRWSLGMTFCLTHQAYPRHPQDLRRKLIEFISDLSNHSPSLQNLHVRGCLLGKFKQAIFLRMSSLTLPYLNSHIVQRVCSSEAQTSRTGWVWLHLWVPQELRRSQQGGSFGITSLPGTLHSSSHSQ